ncbi:protein-tyrosine phosphatase family protein [Spartinivicinus poritis]|uniref:Dual specificity protein phosphatase family protein n=1 Tax=Spartinivicinus poritis TaxID=2994640 RepID=A0ABT5U3T5_9GAMM|nr:dual specificity protein phosphatase family protein [Spartinivicinus sp. A2-2]MDE1461031.1 dual specificity protein phosphatase family protein [Spartinivicinus sp. A2-2]
MIPQVFEVTAIGKGAIFVMPKPSSMWLSDDINYLFGLGITKVVSLLEVHEAFELGLEKEEQELQKHGIEYLNFPIQDRGLPKLAPFTELVESLYKDICDGHNLAIHCRVGIGRTGTLASCILIKDKYDAQTAIDMVSAARGVGIPDTQEQYDLICNYEKGYFT